MAEMENSRRSRIFFASFLTIFASGVVFGFRAAVLTQWAEIFGFTKTELGTITGGGLTGFGVVIILCSLFLDKVGYKPVLCVAFLMHVLSAVVILAATPVYEAYGKDATYACLFWGMFIFSVANGLCEAAVNPLVATLYPKQKTHYLNILHASWPGGLVAGAGLALAFLGAGAYIHPLRWEIPMGLFLVPVMIYGLIILTQKLPQSEVSAAGVSFGEMLLQFVSPILLLLVLLHAMVGYVELGTDGWITNIMENVVGKYGIWLFVWTSTLMFILRFFAGPIVERINPLGLLTISAVLGFIGLNLLGIAGSIGIAFMAATVYALGKTFLWPTMLGVAGERFPRGGALAMGTLGGVGMLSAGLLGNPGIGYKQDYFASQKLQEESPAAYQRYVSTDKNSFLMFPPISGLDGAKVGVISDDGAELTRALEIKKKDAKPGDKELANLEELSAWWQRAKTTAEEDKTYVHEASIYGGRTALHYTSLVPATMAVLYLLLVIYFKMKGGYKQVEIHREIEAPTSEF